MGLANAIKLFNREKAPGGVNPLLQGLGGYTRRVRSRAPTKTSSTKHHPDRNYQGPILVRTLGGVPPLPQGSGATIGYREKGYPKPEPKNDCLDFMKIETS